MTTATSTSHPATFDEAVSACAGPAHEGVPGAMYLMGAILKKSGGATRQREAVQWFEKAAKAGHPVAALELARAYAQSSDDRLKVEGRRWLLFAACSGYAPAESLTAKQGMSAIGTQCPRIEFSTFDGMWSGSLESVKQNTGELKMRISISGAEAHVFIDQDGAWREVKAGKFGATREDATAVLTAIDKGWDADGEWIESWTIHLLRLSESDVLVSFLRSVNNINVPPDFDWRAFTSVREGRLHREKE